MFRNCAAIFTLAIAVLAHFSESGVVPAKQNFTLLGKLIKFSTKTGSGHETQQTIYYFVSQNAAPWSLAASDCKANLGETASLANLVTDEETQGLKNFLQSSDDIGSKYWLGGQYDSEASAFVWGNYGSGLEISSCAPWDQGHPTTRTPQTKVLGATVGGLKLQSDFATVSLRYICELPV